MIFGIEIKEIDRQLSMNQITCDKNSPINKDEFLKNIDVFISNKISEKPIIFEAFTNPEDEDIALNSIGSIMTEGFNAKLAVKKIVGKKGINAIKKVIKI